MHNLFNWRPFVGCALSVFFLVGCGQENPGTDDNAAQVDQTTTPIAEQNSDLQAIDDQSDDFEYEADRFADISIKRYRIPGWDNFTLQQKTLLYFLSQAGMAGRDILWDQNYKHNLRIRKTIEAIANQYPGDRSTDEFSTFMTWAKQVWFANGIHHHYSNNKFTPQFSAEYFATLLHDTENLADFPLDDGQSLNDLIALLTPVIFDPSVDAKKVNTAADVDKLLTSATNFYAGVTEAEAMAFYAAKINSDDTQPVAWGLNSQLTKNDEGEVVERVWKVGGMYGGALEQVVIWLERAITVTETDAQRTALELLVK